MAEDSDDEPQDQQTGNGAAAPTIARFGDGKEGRPARKERGHVASQDTFFGRTSKFVRDVRGELGRVAWPSAIEVRNTTIITVVAVIFFAVYLYAVDRGFAFLIEQVQKLLGGVA
jgi:preprotein translocase SecE subunit